MTHDAVGGGASSPREDLGLLSMLVTLAEKRDPVPPSVVTAAQQAYGLRTVDAELADLVADSLDSAGAVRGPATVRLLSYESPGVTIEVEVTQQGSARHVLGEVAGAEAVVVETGLGTVSVPLDDAGRFSLGGLSRGPFRLRCTTVSGQRVATSWAVL
ncbi:MAG: hypothetical protein JWL64_892 [Frankiales bacterium]|nr:hypothetical protein [Frankiales bacterium]